MNCCCYGNRKRTHKIYELVLTKGTSRDDENAREDDREIRSHVCWVGLGLFIFIYFWNWREEEELSRD